ncbi:cyclic-phosphate processing receiver domain-containing protein [Undibacterium sp.]|jgi:hypothetical protein|uniref:cyclic-phosphate processing receiver domain-containing protein n=1 Tax=Undibacterium sp. TaxID=1914977 RepID=UPI002C1A6967|nr:cyclic-phosphate processing receiver domain-containing protein [Undibacterium sp.]HTD05224.1 cyclic-phosphate processing receiver domain-containing protein [Undibacterium sp.]
MKKLRKRQIHALFQHRCLALTAEDKEWLGMTPVGREFGSKDYDRLVQLDALVEAAKAASDPKSLGVRVFLDDERAAPEGWVRVCWPDEAIDLLDSGCVQEISLDHDLGDDDRGTGYDVILWIEEAVAMRSFSPPSITAHSANSSARVKMMAGIQAIEALVRKLQ